MRQLKILLIISFLPVAIVACQKGDTLITEETSETKITETKITETKKPDIEIVPNNYSINYISRENIPNIINSLTSENGSSSTSSTYKTNMISAPIGGISTVSILEVTDTSGNQNYSFMVFPKTPKPNSIFNLLISTSNGFTNKAIMEYRMTSDFAQDYYNGTKSIAEFSGSIHTFPFSPNSYVFSKARGHTCIQNIDEIVDCSFITLDNGHVTGGGGGGSTTIPEISDPQAGNTGGGFYTGGGGSAVWVCATCSVSHSSPSDCTCGGGGGPGTWIITIMPHLHTYQSGNKTISTNVITNNTNCCNDIDGGIGVNLLTSQVSYIINCLPDLTDEQIGFLNGTLTSFKIKMFLEDNKNPNGSCNQAANEFAEAAIEALENGGEVDFEDKIINDLTGKAKCLHSLLDKSGNNYIDNLMSKFKGNSTFDIKIISKDKLYSEKHKKYVNGNTIPPVGNLITINISTTNANKRSALDVARTILHEYIHADIFRKLDTKYNANNELDFKKSYEAYENQHEAMGALYVNSLRDAMKHFHKNILTDDYNKYTAYYGEMPSDDFYEALAWRGLKEHSVKAWNDLSPKRKDIINNLSLRIDVLTKAISCTE